MAPFLDQGSNLFDLRWLGIESVLILHWYCLPRHTLRRVCRVTPILSKLALDRQFRPQFAPSFFDADTASVDVTEVRSFGT